MRVTLTHAYSTTNSGDGLLVEEAAAIVRAAFGDNVELTLIALDPESFDHDEYGAVMHPLTGLDVSMGSTATLAAGIRTVLRRARPDRVQAAIASSDLVVAVGGGYMRAKAPVEAMKWFLTHAPQLPRQADRVPHVYLPQSIGPLRFGALPIVRRRLRSGSAVFVRDDRSVRDLVGLSQVRRKPDMALLGLPDAWNPDNSVRPGDGAFGGLVARELVSTTARVREYRGRVSALHDAGLEFLAQATARGNNDLEFYRSLGQQSDVARLRDAVMPGAERRPGAVVSVRLHGAIQSIRSGVPAVHLSYERKGWGAYDDLGLSQYVHNAFDFDPDLVMRQVRALETDATEYWTNVAASVSELERHRRDVIDTLQAAATGTAREGAENDTRIG